MKSIPTIHVVDRDPQAHDRMMSLQGVLNMQCKEFLSVREYLDAAPHARPGCLVIDLDLPDITGLELLQAIRHGPDPIPVIVMTTATTVSIAALGMQEGTVTMLEKTCSSDSLKQAIAQAVTIDQSQQERNEHWKVLQQYYQALSPRECQVLNKLVQGDLIKAIALELDLSLRTIELDKAEIKRKFQASTLCELSAKYTEYRLLGQYYYQTDRPSEEILRKTAINDLQSIPDK